MEHNQKVLSILFIRPNAKWSLTNTELQWLDESQTEPTDAEIQAGWVAYQAQEQTEADAKAEAKAALLDRLGITADEAKLLLS